MGASKPDAAEGLLPLRFGDYELIEEVGRGGMGVVYKARHGASSRVVALKTMLASTFADPGSVRRFHTEAETIARLRHEGIVAVLEIGEAEGRLYFTMDYVAGTNLAALAREAPVGAFRAATLLQQIAVAVAYAHTQGVVHRDLKPSNILIDDDGRPRITDFGVAKIATADADLTLTRQALGSPSFCAPEQAAGRRAEVGPRSDVYSLGAVLYCLITGRPPLLADTMEQTLWDVLNTEPVSPRLLNPATPVDLETICLKCIEKAPERRYGTAQQLADELGRFLRGEPIRARRIGPVERAWRWCRRKPALASATAGIIALLAVVGVVVVVASVRLARKEIALQQRAYAADMRSAQDALQESKFGLANYFLSRYKRPAGDSNLRGWEWRYLRAQSRGELPFRVGRHSLSVSALAFSADGGRLVSGGGEGDLKLWDLVARREIASRPNPGSVDALAFAPDGRSIASAGSEGTVRLWDSATLTETRQPFHEGHPIAALQFASDGNELVSVSMDRTAGWMKGRVSRWDLASGQRSEVREVSAWSRAAVSSDGRMLATGGANGELWLSDLTVRKDASSWIAHPNTISALAFSPDGRRLVSAGLDKAAKVWVVPRDAGAASQSAGETLGRTRPKEPYAPQVDAAVVGSDGAVSAAAFSPDGRYLATASHDQTVHVWDTRTWRQLAILQGHASGINSVTFAPNDYLLATGGAGGEVRLWNPFQKPPRAPFTRISAEGRIVSVNIAAVVFKSSSNICLVDLGSGVTAKQFDGTGIEASAFAASPDARWLVAGTLAGDLVPLDSSSAERPGRIRVADAAITDLDFSSDGKLLAAVSARREITLIEFGTGRPIARFARSEVGELKPIVETRGTDTLRSSRSGKVLEGFAKDGSKVRVDLYWDKVKTTPRADSMVADVVFSPDGKLFAAGYEDGAAVVWELRRKENLCTLQSHSLRATELAFSPDGRRLAMSSEDGTASVWDIHSARKIASFHGTGAALCSVSWSPDGRRLATGTTESATLIWDLASGHIVLRLTGHSHSLVRARFLPDGNTLATYTSGELFLWQAPPFAKGE